MPKPKFNITMTILKSKTYTVAADTWEEAVSKASDRAERAGLETQGTVRVADENGNPIDTFA